MHDSSKTNIKLRIVNFFGSVGYFACVFQWLWAILLYFSLIEGFAESITPKHQAPKVQPVTQPISTGSPDAIQVLIILVITIIMAIITVYIIIKMPSIISRTSKKIVHNTADNIAPVVMQIQKKPIEKRSRLKMSSNIVIFIKVMLVFIPILLAIFSKLLDTQIMEFYIVMIITFWLASFAILFFMIQYLMAWAFKLKHHKLW